MTGGKKREGGTNGEELKEGKREEKRRKRKRGEKQQRVSAAERLLASRLTRLLVFLNFLHLGMKSLAFST